MMLLVCAGGSCRRGSSVRESSARCIYRYGRGSSDSALGRWSVRGCCRGGYCPRHACRCTRSAKELVVLSVTRSMLAWRTPLSVCSSQKQCARPSRNAQLRLGGKCDLQDTAWRRPECGEQPGFEIPLALAKYVGPSRGKLRPKSRPEWPRPSHHLSGTDSSNPAPSSGQSGSRGISLCCIEKPAVAAVCAGPARRHGQQRRAELVNITPTAGNISVGAFSRTAVPAKAVSPTVVAAVCQARGSGVTRL